MTNRLDCVKAYVNNIFDHIENADDKRAAYIHSYGVSGCCALLAMKRGLYIELAAAIALWYKTLHRNGCEYLKTYDFIDEYDSLTLENLKMIHDKTGTSDFEVWRVIENNFEQIHNAVMSLPRTLVYTDFHYTNLAVARDQSSALVFDYNFLYKSYVYSDIRNVCHDMSDEAKTAFLFEYGGFDEREVVIDNAVSGLYSLYIACQREVFPDWAKDGVEKIKDGSLLTLEGCG